MESKCAFDDYPDLILNPIGGVSEISQFSKFGQLAFGDTCEPKPAKRIIRVNSSSNFFCTTYSTD